jgi:hypothetical protein
VLRKSSAFRCIAQHFSDGLLENHVKTMVSVDFCTVPTIRFQVLYMFLVLAHNRSALIARSKLAAHLRGRGMTITSRWLAQTEGQVRHLNPFENSSNYPDKSSPTAVAMQCRYPTSQGSCWSRRRRTAWISVGSRRTAAVANFCARAGPTKMGAAAAVIPGRVVFLAQYVQVACEELSGTTRLPSPDSFIALLEALLAVRSLRTDRGGGLDRFYLGNLGVPVATVFSERQFDPELLPHAVADLIQDLRRGAASPKEVVFAGRNLYVALRDEVLSDIVALNRSLAPLLGTLFRLAARGHWIREKRPLPTSPALPARSQLFEPSSAGPFEVAASVGTTANSNCISRCTVVA